MARDGRRQQELAGDVSCHRFGFRRAGTWPLPSSRIRHDERLRRRGLKPPQRDIPNLFRSFDMTQRLRPSDKDATPETPERPQPAAPQSSWVLTAETEAFSREELLARYRRQRNLSDDPFGDGGHSSAPSAVITGTAFSVPPMIPVPGDTSLATIQSQPFRARLAVAWAMTSSVSAANPTTSRGRPASKPAFYAGRRDRHPRLARRRDPRAPPATPVRYEAGAPREETVPCAPAGCCPCRAT